MEPGEPARVHPTVVEWTPTSPASVVAEDPQTAAEAGASGQTPPGGEAKKVDPGPVAQAMEAHLGSQWYQDTPQGPGSASEGLLQRTRSPSKPRTTWTEASGKWTSSLAKGLAEV